MSAHCIPPRGDARKQGFTIVEIVLAVGILVLGATSILGMLTFGAALTRAAELRTAAAAATEAVDSDIDQILFPFEADEVGEPVDVVDREVPGAPGVVYSARAVQNPDEPLEYRVDVSMSWKSAGVQRSRDYSMLRIREIGFGERLRRKFVEPDRVVRAPQALPAEADAAPEAGNDSSPK